LSPDADVAWIPMIAFDALNRALEEAEEAFRESVTREQARSQIIGDPKAVA
jgi:hypothetical protein